MSYENGKLNNGWWIVILFAMFLAFVIGLANDAHERHASTNTGSERK